MVITKMVVTDESGVEHVVEGNGWFRARNQNYKGKPTELSCDAHILLTGDAIKEASDAIILS